MMELDTNNHSVFLFYYHLVLVIKYGRQVIYDETSEFSKIIFERIAESYHITLLSGIMIKALFISCPRLHQKQN